MIRLDFEKFDKAGLKSALSAIEKNGLKIANVDADNRAKRESGYQVKAATIEFESGQKLVLKIKAGGSIYQVRLNGKVVPIKNVDNPDKALLEVVDYVMANEKRYLRQKERMAEQKSSKPPAVDRVRTGLPEQIEIAKQTLDALKVSSEDIAARVAFLLGQIVEKRDALAGLTTEINKERSRNESLQKELNQLLEAA